MFVLNPTENAMSDNPSKAKPPGATQADAQPAAPKGTPPSAPGQDENQPGFIKPRNTPVTPTDDQVMAD